eukprot:gene7537-11861_t
MRRIHHFRKNVLNFQNYSKLTSNEAVEHFKLGEELFQQGNFVKAEKYLLKAADSGHAKSTRLMGNFYALGLTGESSLKKAENWFKKAVKLGDDVSLSNLGSIYQKQGKLEKAKITLEEAIQKFNLPEANIQLGAIYYKSQNYKGALEIFEKFNDHFIAKNYIAEMYLFGNGTSIDYQKSKQLFEEIQNDVPTAKTMLGYIHMKGLGCDQNSEKAKEIFEDSKNSSILSMTFLGQMYVEGIGIEKDEDKGLKLIEKAAGLNEENAIIYLSNYSATVKKNPTKVKSLLKKLIQKKNPFSFKTDEILKNEKEIIDRMEKFVEEEAPKVLSIEFEFTQEQLDELSAKEKEDIIQKKREEELFKRIENNKCQLLFGEEQEKEAEIFVKNLKSNFKIMVLNLTNQL